MENFLIKTVDFPGVGVIHIINEDAFKIKKEMEFRKKLMGSGSKGTFWTVKELQMLKQTTSDPEDFALANRIKKHFNGKVCNTKIIKDNNGKLV